MRHYALGGIVAFLLLYAVYDWHSDHRTARLLSRLSLLEKQVRRGHEELQALESRLQDMPPPSSGLTAPSFEHEKPGPEKALALALHPSTFGGWLVPPIVTVPFTTIMPDGTHTRHLQVFDVGTMSRYVKAVLKGYHDRDDYPGIGPRKAEDMIMYMFAHLLRLKKESPEFFAKEAIMLDIGVNVGFLSLPASALGIHRIIGFDALRANLEAVLLGASATLGPDANRLMAVHGAVSDVLNSTVRVKSVYGETDTSELADAKGNLPACAPGLQATCVTDVPTVVLDEFIETSGLSVDKIAAVKLDCQGCEALALKGAERFLRKNCKAPVMFEYHPPLLAKASGIKPAYKLLEWMKELGYDIYQLTGDNGNIRPAADLKSLGSQNLVFTRSPMSCSR